MNVTCISSHWRLQKSMHICDTVFLAAGMEQQSSERRIDKIVAILFMERRLNADKKLLVKLFIWFIYNFKVYCIPYFILPGIQIRIRYLTLLDAAILELESGFDNVNLIFFNSLMHFFPHMSGTLWIWMQLRPDRGEPNILLTKNTCCIL